VVPTKTLWCENGMRLADDLRGTAGVGRAWWYQGERDLIIVIDPVHELPALRVTLSQALQRATPNKIIPFISPRFIYYYYWESYV